MNFDLKTPCDSCPFRSDILPYLRPARVEGIRDAITADGGTFACHKTTVYEDGEMQQVESSQHCAGALILLAHEGQTFDNLLYRLAHLGMGFVPEELDLEAPVFETWEEMIGAQS